MRTTLKVAVKVAVSLAVLSATGCTKYQGYSTALLDDMGYKYEMVKQVTGNPRADAAVLPDGTIQVVDGRQSVYLILHEIIHKLRKDNGIWLDHRLEEIIAVKAAYKIGTAAKIQLKMGKFEIPALINNTLKVNGIQPRKLTEQEKQTIDEQIEVSFDLFQKRLKEQTGKTIYDIDWVRTAILILL